jgi:hypothetical protein
MMAFNRRSGCLALAVASLLLQACAVAPVVRVNYDPSADFSQYKTFGFASPLGTDSGGYQSLVSLHLKAATQRELESRGLRLEAAAPQLLVNFNASLDDKMRVTRLPSTSLGFGLGGGYYGYRNGLYSAWPFYRDETVVTPYKEGTLNIDVVDSARKQLVWEGVVTDSVTQATLDNVPAAITAAVAAAFAKYPVAGPVKAR